MKKQELTQEQRDCLKRFKAEGVRSETLERIAARCIKQNSMQPPIRGLDFLDIQQQAQELK